MQASAQQIVLRVLDAQRHVRTVLTLLHVTRMAHVRVLRDVSTPLLARTARTEQARVRFRASIIKELPVAIAIVLANNKDIWF